MNGLVILLVAVALFIAAYILYGGWLAKKWGLDDSIKTPAYRLRDDVDYCPANTNVVFGHQFSSIAGAGPITGPIQAIALGFGWLPAYLWIVLGSMFMGGIHDWGALFASVRHDGKSIGEVIKVNINDTAKKIFNIFCWLAITLVVAAFADICAGTFAYDASKPELLTGARAGTASLLFIALAMVFGYFVYRKKANLVVSTIVGVVVLFACVWIGYTYPVVKLTKTAWTVILMIYIIAASVMPVWILLQPRDYLCSYLLYATLAGALLGIIIVRPEIQIPAFNGFVTTSANGAKNYLFPTLFITIACGAVSGFHSLVSSGTASKQINKESATKAVGYGAMLVEGVIAVIAIIAVGYTATTEGTPAQIFAAGVASFMNSFGVPLEVGKVFVTLAFSAFALTSLDTATRLGRYMWQELWDKEDANDKEVVFVAKAVPATLITVGAAVGLILYGYGKIWAVFGASNQLVAGLSLLGLTVWFYKTEKPYMVTFIPMCFMMVVTMSALVMLIRDKFASGELLLAFIAAVLLILGVILVWTSFNALKNNKAKEVKSNK